MAAQPQPGPKHPRLTDFIGRPPAEPPPPWPNGRGPSPRTILLVTGGFVILGIAAILLPAFTMAKLKSERIRCLNNLKQPGLEAHIYAIDHGKSSPDAWLWPTNAYNGPRVLVCPADTKHRAATAWANVSSENIT